MSGVNEKRDIRLRLSMVEVTLLMNAAIAYADDIDGVFVGKDNNALSPASRHLRRIAGDLMSAADLPKSHDHGGSAADSL